MATLSSPTLSKLTANVRNMLNSPNASNSFWTDAELADYLNDAVRLYFSEVVQLNEGQFTTQTDLNIVTDTETVALPTDCFEVKVLFKKVTNGYIALPYQPSLIDNYTTQGGTSSEAYLPAYQFRGNNLVLRPTPNFSETAGLRLEYVQFPETLVNGGDTLSTQVSPIFKELIEMYAIYKAKLKESMVNGVMMHKVPEENLAALYQNFKDSIASRSKYPQYTIPFNPEGT